MSIGSLSFTATRPLAMPLSAISVNSIYFGGTGIWDYVIQITSSIGDLEKRIQKTKDNVEEIQSIMKTWVSPIFKRKDGKRECLLSVEDQHDQMEKYYSCIRESGLKIHALVQVITSPQTHNHEYRGSITRSVWCRNGFGN